MKKTVCWKNKFCSIGMIVFLMLILMISACSDKTTNYSETGNDTHRTEQTGITNALIGIINALNGYNQSDTNQAPTITSANNKVLIEGSSGTFTVTATGNPIPAIALTGSLPSGVTFDAATGVLSGTPAGGTNGIYPLTMTASNGVSPDATQNFALAVVTASTAVLIVHDGTAGIEAEVLANLTSIMTAATLTVTPNVGVPAGDLSGYAQIWDIRFNNTTPLTAGDVTSYTTYLAGGRTLVVIGENNGFATRNNSIITLISDLGGGTITLATPLNPEAVEPPFTGPDTVTSVTFLAPAGVANPGTGAFITHDASNIGAALYYARGTLSSAAAGRLMVVFDVNCLQASATADLQSLIDNMVKLP